MVSWSISGFAGTAIPVSWARHAKHSGHCMEGPKASPTLPGSEARLWEKADPGGGRAGFGGRFTRCVKRVPVLRVTVGVRLRQHEKPA